MKKILSALLLLASLSSQATPISETAARQLAVSFAQNPRVMRAPRLSSSASLELAFQSTGYYAFNRGNGDGFVIVASDDNLGDAIIGYADEGTLDLNTLPEAFQDWFQEMDRQVAYAAQHPNQVTAQPIVYDEVPILLTCLWGQGYPYTALTPNGYPTGCVGTTMSQIMYRHKYPEHGIGSVTCSGQTIDLSQETYDWDNMVDNFNGTYNDANVTAVATLMRDAGFSINSNYSSSVTTAYESSVPNALISHFGYSESICDVYRTSFTKNGWDEVIYNELANGRPVMLGGYNTSGGHNFLTDGYKGGLFHINWGWGGLSNAYLRMDVLEPGAQGTGGTDGAYNSNLEAVIGIQPATDEVHYLDLLFNKSDFKAAQTTAQRTDDTFAFTASLSQGTRASSLSFNLGVEVVDSLGNSTYLPMDGAVSVSGGGNGGGFGPGGGGNQGGTSTTIKARLADFPQGDGVYRIFGVFMGESGQWHRLHHAYNLQDEVRAEVVGNTITLSSPYSLSYDFTTAKYRFSNATPSAGESLTVSLTASCVRGSLVGDSKVGIYQDGSQKATSSSLFLSMDEGESRGLSYTITVPSISGLAEVYFLDGNGNKFGDPAYIVVGGKENPATIKLTEAISMPSLTDVDKNNLEIHAQMTCESGNYVGKVQASIWGGTRYKNKMGVLESDNQVIPEGKTVEVVITGAIETLADNTKYKVYLLDANGAYFDGQSALDNLIFTTGVADGVSAVTVAEESEDTYTLSGVRVSGNVRPGLYIRGGKKYIKK